MISDFIFLEEIERSTYRIAYTCSLPDPDIYGDDKMILCGNINLQEDYATGICTIKIELLDNFKSLCIGDVYQRKHFVRTVFDVIELNTEFELDDAKIILKDYIGDFEGTFNILDETFWEE